jgi:hypothetical protein
MRTLICILTALSVIGCASTTKIPASAPSKPEPVIIELRITNEAATSQPSHSPSTTTPTLTIDALSGQPFTGSTKTGDDTIAVTGSLLRLSDGRYRIRISYDAHGPMKQQALQSTLELSRGEDFTLGGLVGAAGEQLIILRLQ